MLEKCTLPDNGAARSDYTYLILLLQQNLIVLAKRRAEDDGGDALEAMDPLFALGALPADVEHVDAGMDVSALLR